MIFKTALSQTTICKLYDELPYGISAIDPLNKFSSAKKLEKVSFVVLAPLYCNENRFIHNLWLPSNVSGSLQGNCGVLGNSSKYIDPTKNLMPFFHIASRFIIILGCLYGSQSTELMELLLEVACKYINIINETIKNSVRGTKETNILLRVLEHELQRADPTTISIKIITILKKLMVGDLGLRVFTILNLDVWYSNSYY